MASSDLAQYWRVKIQIDTYRNALSTDIFDFILDASDEA